MVDATFFSPGHLLVTHCFIKLSIVTVSINLIIILSELKKIQRLEEGFCQGPHYKVRLPAIYFQDVKVSCPYFNLSQD